MKIVLEMAGSSKIPPNVLQGLIEECVENEMGSFVDKKVIVLMYGEKRRTVRGQEYEKCIYSRWEARKIWRALRKQPQISADFSRTKRF